MTDTKLIDEVVGESQEIRREQALRRIKKRRDFHAHVFVYLVVNIAVWGVWSVIAVTSGSSSPWPVWVTLGWGLIVVLNAWDVYVRRPITDDEIRREMERLGHRR